jgi:hypothetical protein
MLDSIVGKHKMLSMVKNAMKKRLACGYIAGEAFFYLGGDRLEVRTPGVHPGNVSSKLAPRALTSGTVTVGAAAAPDLPPRDWAPELPIVSNIAIPEGLFHRAPNTLNVTDWARHEHPSSRQAN